MRKKSGGYLLVDIVLALSLISLLFLGIGKTFSTYLGNKRYSNKLIEITEIMNSFIMEVKYNIEFDVLDIYEKGVYILNSLSIDELIGSSIKEILDSGVYLGNYKSLSTGWYLELNSLDEDLIRVRLSYNNEDLLINKGQEEIIYRFIE